MAPDDYYDDDDFMYDLWKDEQDDCIFDDRSPAFPDEDQPVRKKYVFTEDDPF